MPCDDINIKETTECNTYISCQVDKQPKISFKNGIFVYDGNNITDLELFSFGNKDAVRLDNLAWIQIKDLIVKHNNPQTPLILTDFQGNILKKTKQKINGEEVEAYFFGLYISLDGVLPQELWGGNFKIKKIENYKNATWNWDNVYPFDSHPVTFFIHNGKKRILPYCFPRCLEPGNGLYSYSFGINELTDIFGAFVEPAGSHGFGFYSEFPSIKRTALSSTLTLVDKNGSKTSEKIIYIAEDD